MTWAGAARNMLKPFCEFVLNYLKKNCVCVHTRVEVRGQLESVSFQSSHRMGPSSQPQIVRLGADTGLLSHLTGPPALLLFWFCSLLEIKSHSVVHVVPKLTT